MSTHLTLFLALLVVISHSDFVPLYRYIQRTIQTHFYTTIASEIGTTTPGEIGKFAYESEGTECFISDTQEPDTFPLYRYYNEGSNYYFYTLNPNEIGTTTPGGFMFEKIEGFCYQNQNTIPNLVPLYRYSNTQIHDYLYTTDSNEIGTTTPGQTGNYGYTSEGITCYVAQNDNITINPTISSMAPSLTPTNVPTVTTITPTSNPTSNPTSLPTFQPTQAPIQCLDQVKCSIVEQCTRVFREIKDHESFVDYISINIPHVTNPIFSSIKVHVRGTHSWQGDLTMILFGPDLTFINLVSNEGGSADHFDITFSDSGTPINGNINVNGAERLPEGGSFSQVFNNKNINGYWGLGIEDSYDGDEGLWEQWCLKEICWQ